MRIMGISKGIICWVSDFLTQRQFRVQVCDAVSTTRQVISGVPQGSVLDPTLFLIYINDLLERFSSPALAFADDVKLWREVSSDDDVDALQEDFNKLVIWCLEWCLPLNREKCKYLHIGKESSVNAYHLNGRLLSMTSCEKDPGVMITNTLKTAAHTNMVCTSARVMLGAIQRSFIKLTAESFQLLYSTHVRSRLEYGGQWLTLARLPR